MHPGQRATPDPRTPVCDVSFFVWLVCSCPTQVPALCFTPICPHSLSFRPLLIPDCSSITIEVANDARSGATASVDGQHQTQLNRGDKVRLATPACNFATVERHTNDRPRVAQVVVRVSNWPLPVITRSSATGDWIRSIKRTLLWNARERQKGLASL